MLPGIGSTHEHPLLLMAISSGLTLEYTQDAEIMLASVREYVEANPTGPMFSFGGSYEGRVEIFRRDIDAIVSDRPFVMVAASGHAAWVNTAALEAAGITKDTEDPIDSFQREAFPIVRGLCAESNVVGSSLSSWHRCSTRLTCRRSTPIG